MSEAALRKNANLLIDMLPIADVQKVIQYAMVLHKVAGNPFDSISEEEMLADLALSRQQAAEGKVSDFDSALNEISLELGIS